MPAPQHGVHALALGNGLVTLDEHRSVSCMIHDITATGLRLTLLDASDVPGTFLLSGGAQAHVCTIVRRSNEEIEACFTDLGGIGRSSQTAAWNQRTASESGHRGFAQDRPLGRAA